MRASVEGQATAPPRSDSRHSRGFATTIRHPNACTAVSSPRASDGYAVYAHLGLADGDETRGAARDAMVELDRALAMSRQIGDHIAEADALLTLAFARGRLAGVRVAAAYIDTAAGLIPDTAFDLRSRLLSRRAIVHALYGRAAPASAAADSSVSFARRAADRRLEADAYRIVGQVLEYRSQFDSALVALRRSESLYVEARTSHRARPLADLAGAGARRP